MRRTTFQFSEEVYLGAVLGKFFCSKIIGGYGLCRRTFSSTWGLWPHIVALKAQLNLQLLGIHVYSMFMHIRHEGYKQLEEMLGELNPVLVTPFDCRISEHLFDDDWFTRHVNNGT